MLKQLLTNKIDSSDPGVVRVTEFLKSKRTKKAVTATTSSDYVPRPATQSKVKRTIVSPLTCSQGRDLFKITKYTPKEEY